MQLTPTSAPATSTPIPPAPAPAAPDAPQAVVPQVVGDASPSRVLGLQQIRELLAGDVVAPSSVPTHPGIAPGRADSSALLAPGSELGDVRWGSSTLAELAAATPRWKVEERSGGFGVRPATEGARQLEEGAARVRDMVRGMVGALEAREGAQMIGGTTLARSQEQFALGRVMAGHDAGAWDLEAEFAAVPEGERAGQMTELLDSLVADGRGVLAQNLGWVVANDDVTGSLSRAAANPRSAGSRPVQSAVSTLNHELEHSVTPAKDSDLVTPDGEMSPLNWIEEGTAEALTINPVAHEQFAAQLGVTPKWDDSLRLEGYVPYLRSMDALLDLAGTKIADGDSLAAAQDLLQGAEIADVPRRIAERIVEHQGLETGRVDEIAQRILEAEGDPGAIDELRTELVGG